MPHGLVCTLVLPGLLLASLVRADGIELAGGVQLPYTAPDGGNCQWFVQQTGVVQQQGNQPVFGQAGTLAVAGQQPQANVADIAFDEKAKELTFGFQPIGPLKITRRVKFEEGMLRIVDVFDNTTDREAVMPVTLMTNTNFGVTDTQPITDPKHKDVTLGWAANTGAERAAMSLFAGKNARYVPRVQTQPNNNMVSAVVQMKVPPKGRRAMVHWHGTFENADAAVAWAGQLKESRDVADLPADVRRAIVNAGVGGAGLPEGMELLRGTPTADVVELTTGDVLRGDLKAEAYTLLTPRGEVTLPATNVAGVVAFDGRHWVVTQNGQLVAGRLTPGVVSIALAGGQTPAVPVDRVARIGYRSTTPDAPEWKADTPAAFLADGQRFAVALPDKPIELLTRYGPVSLPPDRVAAVLTPPAAAAHTVYLTDGSRLSGVLAATTLGVRAAHAPASQPGTLAAAELMRLQFRTLPDDVGAGVATLGLLGDDRVATRLERPLRLTTGFETVTLTGGEIRSIVRPRVGGQDVVVTAADGSVFRGTIADATIDVAVAGMTLSVPTAAVRDYDNPAPFPPAGVVAKVRDAVRLLNSDDWKTREAAETQLTTIGQPVASLLETLLPAQPPEARDRITTILRTLRKDQPPAPSRLSPVPPIE